MRDITFFQQALAKSERKPRLKAVEGYEMTKTIQTSAENVATV